ncbi:MAG: ribosome maturation factor RimP [Rhodobacteraceae bacterium]|nr:ribosome maturation factor RimP [Paracoccaceae bacterium]
MHSLVTLTPAETRIAGIVHPVLESMGFALVRLRIGGGPKKQLQIMTERAGGGMEISDCAEISRAVSAVLDVEDPIADGYTLEISSPGIDRPLTRLADFDDWSGHTARIETSLPIDGRRRFKGRILGVENNVVRLESDEMIIGLEFASISNAKLVLTAKLLKAAGEAPAMGRKGISK